MEKISATVEEIAEAYGMKPAFVRQLCHAKGQRFATKPNGGRLYINIKKFNDFLNIYWPDYRRTKR